MTSRVASLSLTLLACLFVPACTNDGDPKETPRETPGAEDSGQPDVDPETIEGAAGIVVAPPGGLKTSEAGATATFTVALASRPSADVTIALSSSDEKEGTVDRPSLVFTPENWSAPQMVTVTGVDDAAPDGPRDYKIVLAPATSTDPRYSGLDGDDVTVVNADNDSAGITVTPINGLKTSETGDEAKFTIQLNTKPTADVTVALSSSNAKEGTVSPKSLVFTTLNWNAPQTVTVTGVDDSAADGPQTYKIITAAAVSADKTYQGVDADDVTVINVDNETAGITVTPTAGLSTTEAGGTATFTIKLNSRPTANVTIPLSSSKPAEGTVSPALLVFTPDNWSSPQTVTATGVDDSVADGNQAYSVITGAATSTDPGYAALNADDVGVSNVDNETAGFTVVAGVIATTEAGGTATFTVRLNSKPNGNVTVPLTSSHLTEGTVSPVTLTFTTENWDAPQTVTITGVDDAVADGSQPFKIVTGAATGTDTTGYVGLNPVDVAVNNTDDDSAGFTVSAPTGPTTEAGGTALFTVRLNSQPTGTVTIPVATTNASEGTVSTSLLTFDSANWNAPQIVTVTGQDDAVADGNRPYAITLGVAGGADTSGYVGLNPSDVNLTNTDNDSAGITVTPTTGLSTSESGTTATFTVKLNSKPTANVTIPLSSSKPAEGTVSPPSLTFTPDNWSSPQTVTVTGADDMVADGSQAYSILTGAATSADTGYSGINATDVALTNVDDESAGFTVTPVTGLTTTEAGGTATFAVRLNSKPTGSVTAGLTSSNTKEGTVSPASVTFTTDNWSAPQTITVTGVDDKVADGSQPFTIVTAVATGTDTSGYVGLNPVDVSVSNTDNDSAGFTVSAPTGSTTEAGGTASFTVSLNSQPTGTVTVPVASTDTAEGTVATALLTFNATNWSSPQTVTVTGKDDAVADGNRPYKITLGVAAGTDTSGYVGLNPSDVDLTNTDNDSAGITVTPTTGLSTSEPSGIATFTIKLNSKPLANVTIPLTSSKTTEGTVSPASVVFTTDNWAAPQTVTVTGADDLIADGNQAYSIITGAAVSTDSGYGGLNAVDVSLTNTDNESAGFTITPTSGLTTTEGLGTATFTIKLNSKPLGGVTVGLTSSNTNEGTVSPSSVSFTTDNWNAPQTVTVTGVNDAVADGNQPYTIVTGIATGTDTTGYVGLDPANVAVSNTDNDSAGFTVTAASGPTTEGFGTASFTVKLNSQPKGTVTIPVASSDSSEGTVSTSLLTFDASNWSTVQSVTVTGVDDAVADGNQPYTITLGAAGGTDTTGYVGQNPPDVDLTNTDNDSAGITVTVPPGGLTTTEAAGIATFTIKLNSEPTGTVTIPLMSSKTAEGTISPATLTFSAANWNVPQPVTLTGVDDFVDDGNQVYAARIGPSSSTDGAYNGLDPADPAVTNTDNDAAGIVVSPTSGLVTYESGTTDKFAIVLNSAPTAAVTINLSSSNTLEGTVSPASVTFTAANWNVGQTVTVTGVADLTYDGNVPFTIFTSAAVSTDALYSGVNPSDVSVTNVNVDKEPDCTVTVCGASCAEIHKRFPKLLSGNYLIQTPATKYPFQVYCSGMEADLPADYLNVNAKLNYSGFNSLYGKCATCGDTTNYFSKVRLYPESLRLDTTDHTFASGAAPTTAECYKKYGCGGVLNYGSAGSCGDATGNGLIDIGGHPFAFAAAKNLGSGGTSTFGGSATFTTDRKSARITGGGICGSYGFYDLSGAHPVSNTGVLLTYTGP